MPKILGVLDYRVGNITNVLHSLCSVTTHDYVIKRIQTAQEIKECEKIILPGVGAFKTAMDNLVAYELDSVLLEFAASGKYLLGICLGMQLLFEKSYEFGIHKGLGLIEGEIVRFSNTHHANTIQSKRAHSESNSHNLFNDTLSNPVCKIPHIGWNKNITTKPHRLLGELSEEFYLYFVHSYHARCQNDYILAECEYITRFPSIVGKNNILGIQPHPEKSHKDGLQILKNFIAL